MSCVLCTFLAIAEYAGVSVLLGVFLAGAFLSGLTNHHVEDTTLGNEQNTMSSERATFTETFEYYLSTSQKYILQPLCFFSQHRLCDPFHGIMDRRDHLGN
jgi:hypothetical protein